MDKECVLILKELIRSIGKKREGIDESVKPAPTLGDAVLIYDDVIRCLKTTDRNFT